MVDAGGLTVLPAFVEWPLGYHPCDIGILTCAFESRRGTLLGGQFDWGDVYKRQVLGPMPIGLIAALPMLAAAVWLTLREMKQEEKN